MSSGVEGVGDQTERGAIVWIDIGDSRYGAVSVPTQDILAAIAASLGFELIEKLPLRERVSKDKSKLTQDVLIMRRTEGAVRTQGRQPTSVATHQARWKWFSETVPHQQAPYKARNWGHPLHSACSYQGKMKPSLTHFLIH